jgi:hypothetical protein
MTNPDLNKKTEPRADAPATLHFAAPWQADDAVAHSGSYEECKRLLLSKRRVVQDNSFIMVGEERFSAADINQFGNGSEGFLDSA